MSSGTAYHRNFERSRTPPKVSTSARRRHRRDLRAKGREILSLVNLPVAYSRELILAQRYQLRAVSVQAIGEKVHRIDKDCSSVLAVPTAPLEQSSTDAIQYNDAMPFPRECSSTVLVASATPSGQSYSSGPCDRTSNVWNVFAQPFTPLLNSCHVDWASFVIDPLQVPKRMQQRETCLLEEALVYVASPTLQQVRVVDSASNDSSAYLSDEIDGESEGIDDVCDGRLENDTVHYINLVPDRYKWDPQVGVGETEWHELVQTVAEQTRRRLRSFANDDFPSKAAKVLLAILVVQSLKSMWLKLDFGVLFQKRFEHPELVGKGIDVVVGIVCDDFETKREHFISSNLVHELTKAI